MVRAIIYCGAFLLLLSGVLGQTCTTVGDCPCGSVCVDNASSGQCVDTDGTLCNCQQGCFVYNQFLAPSTVAVEAHGNQCTCAASAQSNSIPACTKLPWTNVPEGVQLYMNNQNCPPLE